MAMASVQNLLRVWWSRGLDLPQRVAGGALFPEGSRSLGREKRQGWRRRRVDTANVVSGKEGAKTERVG